MNTYSIHKDKSPSKTIEFIKGILDNLSIDTEEAFLMQREGNEVTSVRIQIKDTQVGTNGKGSNKENSLASGYSEFIERLQTGFLIDFGKNKFSYAPDEKIFNKNYFDKSILGKETKNKKYLSNTLKLYSKAQSKKPNKTICFPFLSVKTKQIEYIPIIELFFLQASNGLAAGNSMKEALVQGLSEICERYSVQQVIEKHHTLPVIPTSEYEQYKSIKELINYIKSFGYEIDIRDASINKSMPVVAATFKDKNNNIEISFGSHPCLPVAIERCLTEYMQGYQIEDEKEREKRAEFCINRIKSEFTSLKTTRIYLPRESAICKKIMDSKKKYSLNSFIKDEKINNEKLYEFLKNNILKQFDDMYIRNYSFLNFPTVGIYIPKMSLMNIGMDEKSLKMLKNLLQIEIGILSHNLNNVSISKILKVCEYYINNVNDRFITKTISYLPLEVISLFCAILLNKKKTIKKYLNILLEKETKFTSKDSQHYPFEFFKILKEYYNMNLSSLPKEEYNKVVIEKFGKAKADYLFKFINGISEERVKSMLIKKQYQENNQEKIDKISAILTEKYINSAPNQEDLIKIV